MKKKYEHAQIEVFFAEKLDVICASIGGNKLNDGNGNTEGIGSDDIFF